MDLSARDLKVQISTIFHPVKEYSYELAMDWMRDQTYENVSFGHAYHNGEYGKAHGELKALRERCRLSAKESGADVLFFFDIDTIAPLDALEQLLEVDGDIVSGIYFSRAGSTERAVCWKRSDPDQMFLNLEPVSEISGAGMGCCLIHRRVFEACDFNYVVPDDDYPFWDQARRLGFRLRSLNTVRCRHYQTREKYVYHPYGEIDHQVKVEYEIRCGDGVTLNGKHYPRGKVLSSSKIIEEIERLDAPYRNGQLKVQSRVVSHVSANQEMSPLYSGEHKQGPGFKLPVKRG